MKPRRTEEEIWEECPWATNGHNLSRRKPNVLSSLEMEAIEMERRNQALQEKYRTIVQQEQRSATYLCDDAEYLFVAYGSVARCAEESVNILREKGIRAGLFRPITLWPYPADALCQFIPQVHFLLACEMNAGQMVNDIRLAINCQRPVFHYGRMGGVVPGPQEMADAMLQLINNP